jgi:hypothetical protein
MDFSTCLSKMIAPGQLRPNKPYLGGVIQIHVTRACDKACFGCTQGSNLGGKVHFMPPDMFEAAVKSLGFGGSDQYFGVVGLFGGNPAMSPHFDAYCEVLRRLVPQRQRGIWTNHPRTQRNAELMRVTFNPSYSNVNVHMDREAYDMFRLYWPEAHVVGLTGDSRHSPVHLAAKDVLRKGDEPDWDRIWDGVATCDINQKWSAMLAMFRGELRAYFCEVAGAQAILHQDDPDYPDTGLDPLVVRDQLGNVLGADGLPTDPRVETYGIAQPWWRKTMYQFQDQVRKHCPECAVPLRVKGELSQSQSVDAKEFTSPTHASIFRPKRTGRPVVVATDLVQLGLDRVAAVTDYLGNARK